MEYDGPPFTWNEEERRHLRARLDALYFHLYGISREDADYILSTFPIIKREDEKEFKTYLHPGPHTEIHERPDSRRHRNEGRRITELWEKQNEQ